MPVAATAAAALTRCGPEGKLLLLEALQRDAAPSVRAAAATGLGTTGASGARSLVLALQDGSKRVRAAAGEALCEVGAARVAAFLHSRGPTAVVHNKRSTCCVSVMHNLTLRMHCIHRPRLQAQFASRWAARVRLIPRWRGSCRSCRGMRDCNTPCQPNARVNFNFDCNSVCSYVRSANAPPLPTASK